MGSAMAELLLAPARLRGRTEVAGEALGRARARVGAASELVLELVAKAQCEAVAAEATRLAAANAEAVAAAAERRLGELRLEEGERCRNAELDFLRSKFSSEASSSKADRHPDTDRMQEAFAASGELSAVRAELFEEERRLRRLHELVAEREREVAEAASPDERQCFEWYGMLAEDSPEHVAMAMIEADCDGWEQRLHECISPFAFHTNDGRPSGEGVHRLESEIDRIGASERAKRASCAECLHRLAQDGGTWSTAVVELQRAYSVVERMRNSNDGMAADIASCRWRRAGAAVSSLVDTAPLPLRSKEVIVQPNLPKGPRFSAPVLAEWEPKKASLDSDAGIAYMPQAVVADEGAWEAAGREPPKGPDAQGLAFLSNASTQRFRPGKMVSSGFEFSTWGSPADEERLQEGGGQKQLEIDDLTRWAAASFREPLSTALGTPSRPAQQRPASAQASRAPPRNEWVQFDGLRGPPASTGAGPPLPIAARDDGFGGGVGGPPLGASSSRSLPPGSSRRALDPAPASLFRPQRRSGEGGDRGGSRGAKPRRGDWEGFSGRPANSGTGAVSGGGFENDGFSGGTFGGAHGASVGANGGGGGHRRDGDGSGGVHMVGSARSCGELSDSDVASLSSGWGGAGAGSRGSARPPLGTLPSSGSRPLASAFGHDWAGSHR